MRARFERVVRRMRPHLGAVVILVVLAGGVAALAVAGSHHAGAKGASSTGSTNGPGSGVKSAAVSLPAPVHAGTAPSTTAGSFGAASGAGGGLTSVGATGGASGSSSSAGVAAPSASAGSGSAPDVPVGGGGGSGGGATTSALSTAELTAPKVIENATVNLTVGHGSLNNVVSEMGNLAAGDGGFISHSSTDSGGGGLPSAQMTLRIPDAQFSQALASIRALGKVTSASSSGDDVTSQYVDLQSQITALQGTQKQYLAIMAKATSIGDILSVQAQLDSVDSQLQQLEGQQNVLDDQTTYSTIAVSMIEAAAPGHHPKPRPRPATNLSHAWHRAVDGFLAGIDFLVAIAGPLGFILLLLGGGWALYRLGGTLLGRRRRPGPGDAALPA